MTTHPGATVSALTSAVSPRPVARSESAGTTAFTPLEVYRALRDARGLTPTTKLVLFVLFTYADPRGQAFPSESTLAAACGVTDRTVRRALANARSLGVISVEPGRQHRTSRYHFRADTIAGLAVTSPDASAGLHRSQGGQAGYAGRTLTTPRADTHVRRSDHESDHELISDAGASGGSADGEEVKEEKRDDVGSSHQRVMSAFSAEYERRRGLKPAFRPKDGKAVKEALKLLDASELVAVITRAFEHPFVAEKKPNLTYILANLNDFRGHSPTRGLTKQPAATEPSWSPQYAPSDF